MPTTDTNPTSFIYNELYDINWAISNGRRKYFRKLAKRITGHYFPEEVTIKILQDVLAYKWLECERQRENIYPTGEDGIVEAGKEWWGKYGETAYATQIPEPVAKTPSRFKFFLKFRWPWRT